jgi:hypothetical protein
MPRWWRNCGDGGSEEIEVVRRPDPMLTAKELYCHVQRQWA